MHHVDDIAEASAVAPHLARSIEHIAVFDQAPRLERGDESTILSMWSCVRFALRTGLTPYKLAGKIGDAAERVLSRLDGAGARSS